MKGLIQRDVSRQLEENKRRGMPVSAGGKGTDVAEWGNREMGVSTYRKLLRHLLEYPFTYSEEASSVLETYQELGVHQPSLRVNNQSSFESPYKKFRAIQWISNKSIYIAKGELLSDTALCLALHGFIIEAQLGHRILLQNFPLTLHHILQRRSNGCLRLA